MKSNDNDMNKKKTNLLRVIAFDHLIKIKYNYLHLAELSEIFSVYNSMKLVKKLGKKSF